MTEMRSVNLTDGEVAWLLQAGRHIPQPGSPLLGFAGTLAGIDEASLRERGLLETAWGVAFAVLAAPDRQVRVVIPGPSETFVQVFYGARSQPEAGLVGYWLEGDRLHVSFPWEEEDVAAVSSAVVLSTIPAPASEEEFSLDPGGITALAGAIDVMRDRLFRSLTERRPVVDYRFDAAEVNRQLASGAEHDDARWAVTLLRILAPQRLPLGQELSDGELAGLEAAGLVRGHGDGWVPEQALFALAGRWRHPLPAVAHEVMEGADGRIDRYDHRITIRGEGPLLTVQYGDMLSDRPSVSVKTVDVSEYLDGLVEMMRPAERLRRDEWGYVLDPVEVRGLRDHSVVVGTLQPGSWYRLVGQEGDWVRVADSAGPMEGWAPAGQVHRQSEPVAVEPAAVSVPVTAPEEPEAPEEPQVPPPPERVKPSPKSRPAPPVAPAWTASHVAPPEGLQAWANPDPAGGVVANLPGGVELRVEERRADWARVSAANGWSAWVDGRRLVAAAGSPSPRAAAGAAPAGEASGAAVPVERVAMVAAVAIWLSAFFPWWGEEGLSPFDTSLFHVWNGSSNAGWLTIGSVMFLIGIAAIATVFWKEAVKYRGAVAWVVIGISLVWLAATYGYLIAEYSDEWSTAFADLATEYFALGPWVALAAGIALLVKRRG